MKKLILIGGGGHCRVVLDALLQRKEFEIAGIVDKNIKAGSTISGIPVIGDDRVLYNYFRKGIRYAFISLGSTGKTGLRLKLFDLSRRIGFKFPNIVHPTATISGSVKIGMGCYIGAGAIINCGVKVGDNCIINTGAIIEHGCTIGSSVHIAPGVMLGGKVKIGKGSHVGTGSSVLQCLKIGANSIIGIGSVVIKDVEDEVVACGNPCKKIKDNE